MSGFSGSAVAFTMSLAVPCSKRGDVWQQEQCGEAEWSVLGSLRICSGDWGWEEWGGLCYMILPQRGRAAGWKRSFMSWDCSFCVVGSNSCQQDFALTIAWLLPSHSWAQPMLQQGSRCWWESWAVAFSSPLCHSVMPKNLLCSQATNPARESKQWLPRTSIMWRGCWLERWLVLSEVVALWDKVWLQNMVEIFPLSLCSL